jgi:hypothetical protein
MTFAYGRETRRRVLRALGNLRNFQGNESLPLSEGLTGLNGPLRRLLSSPLGALPEQYAETLRGEDVQYVVYCYGTPIAWVTWEDGETGRVNYVPDWQYSATTTYYQGLVMEAWGGKCVDPNPRKSRKDNLGTARGRSSDARYGRVRGAVPVDRPGSGRASWRTTERMPEGLLEGTRGRVGRTAPSGPPARAAAGPMTRAQYLADPRLNDPDWTPWVQDGASLPDGADRRDMERVQNDGRQVL